MSQLRKSKEIWSGKDEEVGLGIAKNALKTMTDERATMLEEKAMLKQRADAMADANTRAADGAQRKLKREEADMMRLRKKCVIVRCCWSACLCPSFLHFHFTHPPISPFPPSNYCLHHACRAFVYTGCGRNHGRQRRSFSARRRCRSCTVAILGARVLQSGACGVPRSMRCAR